MQLTISFLVIFAVLADLTSAHEDNPTENDFSYCIEYCGCKEDGGFSKMERCIKMLGEADMEYAMDFFGEEYQLPEPNLDVLKVEGCKNTTRAKKTFDEYYNARKEHEKEKRFTPEDEQKLQECRPIGESRKPDHASVLLAKLLLSYG